MKSILVGLFVLMAASAHAATEVGSAELVIYPDGGARFSALQVNDTGNKLVGVGGANVYLERQEGGYRGFSYGHPMNISCNATACVDKGPTQMDIRIKPVPGGYKLEGTVNFSFVNATVTDGRIDFSATGGSSSIGFELAAGRNGRFSGNGSSNAFRTFSATLTTTGSLAGLKDPATFLAVIASPFIGQ